MSYYTATILVGAHRFGDPFSKLQTFSEIFWAHCMHRDINPLKNITPPLSCQAPPPLNLQTVKAAPFLGNPPLYWFFVNPSPPPPKSRIFQWNQIILRFFILNCILSFKSNEILSWNFPVWIFSYNREKKLFLNFFCY